MTDLTIIIPLVEYSDTLDRFFERSINSIINADNAHSIPLIFIGPTSTVNVIKRDFDFGEREVLYIENNKNLELQFQINKAVKDVTTAYFTVLEYDDNFTKTWFNNVSTYVNHKQDTSLFLPLVEVFDDANVEVGAIRYANEPAWSAAFVDEIGYIDNDSLKQHFDFIVSGGVFKKSDFLSVGGLKNNIKVFFWYELLLRMTHNDKRVMVIPKVGYEHYVNIEGSLSSKFYEMGNEELDFWFNTAREEYVYKTDRKIERNN